MNNLAEFISTYYKHYLVRAKFNNVWLYGNIRINVEQEQLLLVEQSAQLDDKNMTIPVKIVDPLTLCGLSPFRLLNDPNETLFFENDILKIVNPNITDSDNQPSTIYGQIVFHHEEQCYYIKTNVHTESDDPDNSGRLFLTYDMFLHFQIMHNVEVTIIGNYIDSVDLFDSFPIIDL